MQHPNALIWMDTEAVAHDGEWPIHVGVFDSDHNQVVSTSPTIDIRTSAGFYTQWSPDGNQLLLHGWSVLTGYYDIDVLTLTANEKWASRVVLNKVCCGVRCDWGPSPDGRYLVCDVNISHGQPPSLIVDDAKYWQRLCANDYFYQSSRCPPLRLSDGRWWHIVGVFGETKITDSPDEPSDGLKRQPAPTPDNFTQAMQAVCQANPEKCDHFSEGPSRHFIAIQSKSGLFVWGTEQRQIWKVTGTRPDETMWSADGRYLAWLDQKQLWIFDTTDQSVRRYIIPDAEIVEFEWSPLQ